MGLKPLSISVLPARVVAVLRRVILSTRLEVDRRGSLRRRVNASIVSVGQLHQHRLDELFRSPAYRDPRVRAAPRRLTDFRLTDLWPGGIAKELMKARLRTRASWLVPVVRRIREARQT